MTMLKTAHGITALTLAGLTGLASLGIAAANPSALTPDAPRVPFVPDEMQILVEEVRDAQRKGGLDDLRAIIEFSETRMFLEENATDGDLGIQFKFDGEDWERVLVYDPNWRRMVDVRVRGRARQIGLTEIQSESAEPSFEDMPRDEFLALFPEGTFWFFGETIEGDLLVGEAELTHELPDQPVVTSPEEDDEVSADDPFTVSWLLDDDDDDDKRGVDDDDDAVIVAYQVIVEKDEDDERLRVLTVDMLPTDTSVTIPVGFLEPGRDYKIEVIAEEESGNKIITEVPFSTAE